MEQNWLMGLYPEIMEIREIQNLLGWCNSIDEIKSRIGNWIGNVVDEMEGIPLTKKEGAIIDSVIKINYIFTISDKMVKKRLFSLSQEKKKILISESMKRVSLW